MKRKFLYYLTDEVNRFYTVTNGVVGTTASPVALNYSPDGWMNKSIKYDRNLEKHGLNRTFTVPLSFVNDGALILKNIYYKKSSETIVNLIIAKLDVNDGVHKLDFRGEIDFSTFKDKSPYVDISVSEGGLTKYIKAYQNTTYEIPMEVDEAVSILLDGLNLRQTIKYVVPDYDGGSSIHTPLIVQTVAEGTSVGVNFGQQGYHFYGGSADVSERTDFLVGVNGSDLSLEINGEIKIRATSFIPSFVIGYQTNTGRTQTLFSGPITAGTVQTITLTDFDLLDHEFLMIVATAGVLSDWDYVETEFEIKYITRYQPTTCRALPASYVFAYLIDKITEGKYSASSTLLESMTDVFITCGDAIRKIPGAKIKTTLSDFFKWINSYKMVGLGEDKGYVADLELREFFYHNTEIFYAGEVKDLEVSTAVELMNNSIKAGYPNQKYDERNGRDEPNTTHLYKAPLTRFVKEYDLGSPYRVDMYGIEFLRINLEQKKTTDSGSDNETFVLNAVPRHANYTGGITITDNPSVVILDNVTDLNLQEGDRFRILSGSNTTALTVIYAYEPTPADGTTIIEVVEAVTAETLTATVQFLSYDLNRPAYTITGLIDPDTAFNINFSPKRMLINHGPWIRSFLYMEDAKKLTFQTTDKNADMVTTLAGVTITENSDVTIGTMGSRMFLPRIFTFSAALPYNVVTLVKANPYGFIRFTWNDEDYKGFVLEVAHRPHDEEVQTIKLLSTPDNDLSKLINA